MKAAAIDLDGTLADTMGEISAALQDLSQDLGLPAWDKSQVLAHTGRGTEHLIRQWLVSVNHSTDDMASLVQRFQEHYQHHLPRSRLYPDVLEGLQRLAAADIPMVCTTNKPHAQAVSLLQTLGIAGFFLDVIGPDSVGARKPDPAMLQKAGEVLGKSPQEIIVIGDTDNDVRAASNFGCPVICLTTGYGSCEDLLTLSMQHPSLQLSMVESFSAAVDCLLMQADMHTSSY